jgi:hypothetical protein
MILASIKSVYSFPVHEANQVDQDSPARHPGRIVVPAGDLHKLFPIMDDQDKGAGHGSQVRTKPQQHYRVQSLGVIRYQ